MKMKLRNLSFVILWVVFTAGCNLGDDEPSLSTPSEPDTGFNNVMECGEDELFCDEECVDITSTEHCGGCGNVCGMGEACVDGICQLDCAEGELVCDGACVDPSTDVDFCGATADCQGANAGTACIDDEVCMAGMCACITNNPGVSVSQASGVADEGGEAVTYTVVLTEEPCSPVNFDITTDAQVTVTTTSLTFSPENWDQTQTVEVFAVLDAAREMEHSSTIEHTVSSDDPAYDGFEVDSVAVDIANRVPVRKVVVAADGSDPDGHSYTPDVSDDGRYVAFLSKATNLTTDTITDPTINQVFWRDLETGETRLVSAGMNGPGDGNSTQPRISSDGQTVAFASASTNLTMAAADSGSNEIFVYSVADDMLTQITDTCSTCSNRSLSPNHSMSADGDLIAFTTRRQLVAEDASVETSVYTYRRSTQELELVSLNANDEYPTRLWGNNIFTPVFSANARYVGWTSAGGNLVSPDPTVDNFHAYFKDLDTGTVRRVSVVDDMQTPCTGQRRSTASGTPWVANDGATALFSTECPMDGSASSYASAQIYVWNDAMQTNTRITRGSDGLPDGVSVDWGFSEDGQYALIASRATNLIVDEGPDNASAVWQLYVYDASTDDMTAVNFGREYRWSNFGLAYRADAEADSDSPSWAASMSRNGQHVVYATVDPMLGPESATPMTYANIYLVTLF